MLFSGLFRRLFGSRNQRLVKRMSKVVKKINALEAGLSKLDDQALQAKTSEFRDRLKKDESLDSLLMEAFAVVREASKRTLGMRHFDVQLIGGMVLHQGKIAEMRTGEGKTLMSTLAAYLNALPEKGVHLITVNDYLAKRDAEWMKPVYDFLGLTVGVNVPNMSPEEKREAYAADITYSTNNECGFDYLRDNMAFTLEDKVQRGLHYAILDEVDSILIDEARTPLIISGPSDDGSELYKKIDTVIPALKPREGEEGPGDYFLDEKNRQAYLTEDGHQHIEELLAKIGLLAEGSSLYDASNITLNHYVNASLRAHTLFQKDVDYIVKDDEIVIVDEHTGRTMEGRRWSEGLHQAIEAKERVKIQQENQTLASITFQNYFRVYGKLSGMTGTADTEAYEFHEIYNLEVVVIPTNKPMVRKDSADKVFLNQEGKFNALIEDIKVCHEKGQPVLVGTASVEASEHLSDLLNKAEVKHNVLNAKFHEKEADIIVEAGCPGAVTIATNMAGRGTDIVLGGNLEFEIEQLGENPDPVKGDALKAEWKKRQETVLGAGGLAVLGSERHQSRRIDNQLRGRSGRQGDPGASRFYLSMKDDLMRIFASNRVTGLMKKLGMKENEAIEHPWINKAIASAQRKVEGFHFDVRKELLEYDNVANDQRNVIYDQRNQLLIAENSASDDINNMRHEVVARAVGMYVPPNSLEEQWDVKALEDELSAEFGLQISLAEKLADDKGMDHGAIVSYVVDSLEKNYAEKIEKAGAENMQKFEKSVMLQTLDSHWREHLSAMDHLRQGIHLRGYAQKNPKQEYRREAFDLFVELLDNIKYEVVKVLSAVHVDSPDAAQAVDEQRRQATSVNVSYQHNDFSPEEAPAELPDAVEPAEAPEAQQAPQQPMRRDMPKVGRNDPCPCGSGKKYKQCHGKV